MEQGLKNEMPEESIEQIGYADRTLNAAEIMEKKKMSATQLFDKIINGYTRKNSN